MKQELLTGLKAGDKTFKVHLDGYNFIPFFKGNTTNGPRKEFFYFDDNANLNALRYNDWKVSFAWIQGNLFTGQRKSQNVPIVVNLREDPLARIFHSEIEQRRGERVRRLDITQPNENTTHRFINDRL